MNDSAETPMKSTALETSPPLTQGIAVSRRQMLSALGVLAASGAIPAVSWAQTGGHDHGMAGDAPESGLVGAASHCVTVGNACLAHIFRTFRSGGTELAECGILVDSTIAACEAVVKLTLNGSPHAKAMASVCQKECEDCAKECRRHAEKHAICEMMAQSCEDTAAVARKFIG